MARSKADALRTPAMLAALAFASLAAGAPVGLVTDVDGGAQQAGEPLKLLAEMSSGAEVDVAASVHSLPSAK